MVSRSSPSTLICTLSDWLEATLGGAPVPMKRPQPATNRVPKASALTRTMLPQSDGGRLVEEAGEQVVAAAGQSQLVERAVGVAQAGAAHLVEALAIVRVDVP